jgi:endonuclease/exonuclease/phosphatase family metal-dependent hydrolase
MGFLRGFWPRSGAAVAVAGAALAAVVVASGPSIAAGAQTYLQFNMCGNSCNHGGLRVVRNLEDTVAARRPYAVTLNEVCENQYDQLRAEMRAYQGRFDPTGPTCRNGSRYGNAILVRASHVDLLGSWPLPDPSGGEPRRLMCLSTATLVVCVTHISYLPADIGPQIAAVAGIIGGTKAWLVGGDFNTEPTDPRLDPVSSTCESPGSGYATMGGRKIDYIFLRNGGRATARAVAIDLSDHRALLATEAVARVTQNGAHE